MTTRHKRTEYRQRLVLGALLFFVLLTMTVVTTVIAACPDGTTLKGRRRLKAEVESETDEIGFGDDLRTNINLTPTVQIDANLVAPPSTIPTTQTVDFSRWQWKLRIPRAEDPGVENLIVTYDVVDDTGQSGVLSSAASSVSKIVASASTQNITKTTRRRWVVYKGYVTLDLDFSNASYAGDYLGTVSVVVDCN